MPDTGTLARAPSVCPHDCPSVCAIEVEIKDRHTIGRVHGSQRNDYTAGVVCAKVARYHERIHHPDRLTEPLIRVGDKGVGRAAFKPIGWTDALDLIAAKLIAAEKRHGPETVWPYFYAGTMGLVQRDGIERLRHEKKWSRQYSTICVTLADTGWAAGVGEKRGADAREMADSDLIVIWGTNPVSTQVNVMTHAMRARKNRGAKIVVVDPYRTGTAEQADIHLMLRPSTDAALACAVMHVLFKEGYADRDYLRRYTDASPALEAHLAAKTPEWAAAITGLSVEQIVDFARAYGQTKRSFIRLGYGFARNRAGSAAMHAASCLPAVTGAWTVRGGGALYGNSALAKVFDRSLITGLEMLDKSVRAIDQSRIGPALTGDKRDLRDGPPITALLIQNTNPMMVAPETNKVRAGFMRDDLFVAVHEQFMTETAKMADIVLPATMFLEHDDIYTASGHTFLQVARKVVEPPPGVRENHFVHVELAKRLGATHRGFAMTPWQIIDESLRASGLPGADEILAKGGLDLCPPFETGHFLDGFPTATGKFRFAPDWSSLGREAARMPKLPDQIGFDDATSDRPFRLVAAPARSYLNSTFTETPSSIAREQRPTVLIHPADLAALGAADGRALRLGNTRGDIVVHAKGFDGVQRGVVVVESIWPNAAFVEGRGINTLTSAEPGPPAGGAVFHDTAIWIRTA